MFQPEYLPLRARPFWRAVSEQFNMWSQNLADSQVLTTGSRDGTVSTHRQRCWCAGWFG
jgi:hypothetical protein